MIAAVAIAIAAALAQAPAPRTPGAPGGAGGVRPPFLPNAGTVSIPQALADRSLPKPYLPGARQFLVQPGQAWQYLVEDIAPGDEVVLAPGFHLAQTIVGLRGEPGRPVFIRSQGPVPAAVLCEGDGLVLRNPVHVVLENVLFIKPRAAALTIEGADGSGNPVKVDVTVRNSAVQGAAAPGQDGILVRNATDVRIDGVRIDGWNDAAVEIQSSRRVVVRGLMAVPDAPTPPAAGIVVGGASSDVSITGCALNGPVKAAIRVGDRPDGAPLGIPAERVRMDRCIVDGASTAVEFANVRDVVVSRMTIANPSGSLFAVADGCGTSFGIEIDRCLAAWQPGSLTHFLRRPPELRESSVRFGLNLWFSKELPEAWSAIGTPYGVITAAALTDVDPDLDPATLRPRNAAVGDFGAYGMAGAPEAVPTQP